jgi:hypothetical protein
MHFDNILITLYVHCIPILCTSTLYLDIMRMLYTDPMHFDIILTQLYAHCIPILCTLTLYLPNYMYVVYQSYALRHYTYVIYRSYALRHYTYPIIRALYTDPMHFDIILTQLYVRCIPILCTWTLYLPNYTYVVYRSYTLGHYTYPIIRTLYTNYTYIVYQSYALGHYTYPIIRTLYTNPMHFDIISNRTLFHNFLGS